MTQRPKKISAGLLLYRRHDATMQVLLVHPGGPFWAKKDLGAWSIPKGEVEPGDDLLATARREFTEELGAPPPAAADCQPLGTIRQKGGKEVHAWAFAGNWDEGRQVQSNTFELEWPPRSGRKQQFPEVDRAELFNLEVARDKINQAQASLLDRLVQLVMGT